MRKTNPLGADTCTPPRRKEGRLLWQAVLTATNMPGRTVSAQDRIPRSRRAEQMLAAADHFRSPLRRDDAECHGYAQVVSRTRRILGPTRHRAVSTRQPRTTPSCVGIRIRLARASAILQRHHERERLLPSAILRAAERSSPTAVVA